MQFATLGIHPRLVDTTVSFRGVLSVLANPPVFAGLGARSACANPEWPKVGIFGHRNMRRVNWLGVSRTRLLRVDGLDLHVAELDAVDGTPVLDIKPWFAEFGPRGEVQQAPWSTEMLEDYFWTSTEALLGSVETGACFEPVHCAQNLCLAEQIARAICQMARARCYFGWSVSPDAA
ncbi:TrmO family methyltransferase [Nocardia sp. NPDC019255]|uniref:TrmO family methyltransferase domain-containing protein n=1 Tax=Nocardia sp. NPDC019255 TaxID=3154591 RepID=UPI003411D4A3